jgi:pimeloyl-ACP methyl ester carboxylesterase
MNRLGDRYCLTFALSLIVLLAACQTIDAPHWNIPAGVKTVWVNGYPMAYVERGVGPTVVLVHGATSDYRYWAPQLDSLPSQFRVVAVSLRHYYPEPWKGEGEFSLKLHSDDLTKFIEHLGGSVDLVGHSRGGPVALATAHSRPDLVRKLVLMDPALFALLPPASSAPGDDPRIRRAKAAEVYLKRDDIEGGLQYFFDDSNGPGAWSRLPEGERRVRRDNAWAIVGMLGDVETVTCADIARLKMPVLLMTGEKSPPMLKSIGAAFRKCLPSATFATIPNAAHQMNQMNPSAYDVELSKFLSW